MFTVYIIKSKTTKKYYTGYTSNLNRRLNEHNKNKTKSIRRNGPFKLIYKEEFSDRQSAYRRERQIKSYKGGRAFKELIDS